MTVGLLAAYHGLAAVAAGGGLWALAPALSAVDVAFVVVSASTQTGLLPVPFKDLGTPAQALVFALVIATSAFLVNHLAPTIVAELRLRQRHRAHRREPEHRAGNGPHPATATTTAAVARPVMPAPLEEELAAVVQLRHVTVAYYVCVQAAFLAAFVIHAGKSPAVLTRLRQTGQSSLAWSVTQTLSAFHQVPFLLDLAPIADADGHLDVATLLLTALFVLLGNLLAPLALYAVVAALAALARRKRATHPFRRLLARAAAISPLLLPTPYHLLLLGALVAAGIVVHASVLLAITLTTTTTTAAGSVGEQVLAAVFSATALRTAGLTAVAIPALPLVGQLFYTVSMAVGAGPLTLVVRLARPLASTGVGTRVGTVDAQRAPSESTAASLSLLVLQVRQRDGSALSAGSAGSAAAGGTGSGPSATLPRALTQLKRRASHCSLPVPFEATSLDDDDAWPLTAPVRTDSRTETPWATVAHSQQQDQQEQQVQLEQQHGTGGDSVGVVEDRPLGADNSNVRVPWAAALPPPATAATASAALGLGKRRVLAVARAAFALVLRLDVVALLLALLVMAALEQQPNGDGYGAPGSALAVRLLFLLASSYGLIGLAPGLVLGVVDGVSFGTKIVLMLVMLLGRLRTFPPAPSR